MSGQQTIIRRGGATARVAILGPDRADVLAYVHGSGGRIIPDAEAADIVHLTVDADASAEALSDVLGAARCVVLHERPTGLGPTEIADLAVHAERAGTVVAVPFVHRYYPMVRLARRRVRSGTPGPLHMLHGWATHDARAAWCDLVEFVSGHRIQRVVSTSVPATILDSPTDAPATPGAVGMLFETDRGAVGTVSVSQSRPIEGGTLLMVLDGVEESVVFHEGRPEVLDVMGPRATQRFQRGVGSDVSRYSTQPAGLPQGHRDCWASFMADADAVGQGRTPDGLPTLVDLARTASLSAAIRESNETATWVTVGSSADLDALSLTEGKSR